MKKKYWMICGGIAIVVLIVAIIFLATPNSNHQGNGKSDGQEPNVEIEDTQNQTDGKTSETDGNKIDKDDELKKDKDNSTSGNLVDVEGDTPVVTPSGEQNGTDSGSTSSGITTDTPSGDTNGEEPKEDEKTDSESTTIELPFVPFP